MIATSGFLTALECIKFVFGRRRRSALDATGSGVFTTRSLVGELTALPGPPSWISGVSFQAEVGKGKKGEGERE